MHDKLSHLIQNTHVCLCMLRAEKKSLSHGNITRDSKQIWKQAWTSCIGGDYTVTVIVEKAVKERNEPWWVHSKRWQSESRECKRQIQWHFPKAASMCRVQYLRTDTHQSSRSTYRKDDITESKRNPTNTRWHIMDIPGDFSWMSWLIFPFNS